MHGLDAVSMQAWVTSFVVQVCLDSCVLEAHGGSSGAHLRNGGPSVSGWFSLILHSALDRRKSIRHSARRLARAAAGGGGEPEAWAPLSRLGGPSGGGDDARDDAGHAEVGGRGGGGRAAAKAAGGTPRHDPKEGARTAHPTSRARARIKGQSGDLRASIVSPDLAPDVFFLRVKLEETGELFRVANCRNDMTVRELKEELDLMVGIPFNLQRLQFLDQGILMDDATLRFYDVIPGAVISLCIWHYDGWTELVLAAVEGDPSKLSCLGISEDTFYRTANSQHFKGEQWRQWTAQRAFVALYISAHRGHVDALQYLLELGANCQGKSPLGRTPLHVVAAMGRMDCIGPLLERGASIHDRDAKGETPITIARRLKRRNFERRMFLLYWMIKSGNKDPTDLS